MPECAHKGCHCEVDADQAYCCDACEKAEQEGKAGCACDHADCGSE